MIDCVFSPETRPEKLTGPVTICLPPLPSCDRDSLRCHGWGPRTTATAARGPPSVVPPLWMILRRRLRQQLQGEARQLLGLGEDRHTRLLEDLVGGEGRR